MIPNVAHIISYRQVYGDNAFYKSRLELIKDIPIEFIIGELAAINYCIKPPKQLFLKTDYRTQVDLAKQLVRRKNDQEHVVSAIAKVQNVSNNKTHSIAFFTRATSLFGIKELLLLIDGGYDKSFKASDENWLNIFKYLLCINEHLDQNKIDAKNGSNSPFEPLFSRMMFINELAIYEPSIFVIERFYHLVNYLENNTKLRDYLNEYFISVNLTKKEYLTSIASLFFKSDEREIYLQAHYSIDPSNIKMIQFLNLLSDRTTLAKSEYDLIDIRKAPFLKVNDTNFLLLDSQFLLDKLYQVFINEFYWEYLKDKMNYKEFMSEIGYFFEDYTNSIFERSFPSKHEIFKPGKILIDSKGDELADFYIRHNSKVAIGQTKVTSLLPEQFSGDLDSLFKDGKDNFYSRFGMAQIVESVKKFLLKPEDFDNRLTSKQRYNIYPILMINERSLKFILAPKIFQDEFSHRIKDIKLNGSFVAPLTIIHLSDLELIDCQISAKVFFEILKKQRKTKGFLHPFESISQKYITTLQREFKVIEYLEEN